MRPSVSYQRIYDVVRRIPAGRVATYGQVAEVAGLPGHARLVGYALAALPDAAAGVPWHRVVNARGMVSARGTPGWELAQRARLESEGVRFDGDRLALDRYRWHPRPGRSGSVGRRRPGADGARPGR